MRLLAVLLFLCAVVPAQVAIKAHPVAEGIHMITGNGGNIGLLTGPDGLVMIDSQYAPLTASILSVVRDLSTEPLRLLINTHWHGDHVGGNANLSKTGPTILAHKNVRTRMEKGQFMETFQREVPPAEKDALPKITFEKELTLHWNGEVLNLFHCPSGHTDGDIVVHFQKANVFHMGDLFFNGMYPFLDVGSGGSSQGLIAAADRVLAMTNEASTIIPGHGPLAKRKDLKDYRDMLATAEASVRLLVEAGLDKEAIIKRKPTEALDERFGKGFMKPDLFTGLLVESIQRSTPR
jgi:glyoxylase-like metal-dependent hydrolase (beta-lactamase superfamily II)